MYEAEKKILIEKKDLDTIIKEELAEYEAEEEDFLNNSNSWIEVPA